MHGYADAQVFDGPDDGAELEVDARAVEVQRADVVHSVERKRVVVVCFRIVVVVAVENVLNADGESQIEDVLDVEASRYAVLVDASLVDVAHRRIDPRAGGQVVRHGVLGIVLRVAHRVEYPRLVCQNAAPQADVRASERLVGIVVGVAQRREGDAVHVFGQHVRDRFVDPLSVGGRSRVEVGQFRVAYAEREARQRSAALVQVERHAQIAQCEARSRVIAFRAQIGALHVVPCQRRADPEIGAHVHAQPGRIDAHRRQVGAERRERASQRGAACRRERIVVLRQREQVSCRLSRGARAQQAGCGAEHNGF